MRATLPSSFIPPPPPPLNFERIHDHSGERPFTAESIRPDSVSENCPCFCSRHRAYVRKHLQRRGSHAPTFDFAMRSYLRAAPGGFQGFCREGIAVRDVLVDGLA